MKRVGKRTAEWERVRAILKKRFADAGITRCELEIRGCWGDNGLGFCHVDKRRFLTPDELWIVVLGCNACHDKIERLPRYSMRAYIETVIDLRGRHDDSEQQKERLRKLNLPQ